VLSTSINYHSKSNPYKWWRPPFIVEWRAKM